MLFTFIWNCLCFVVAFLLINATRIVLEYIADSIISVPLNRKPTYHLAALTELLGFMIWLALWIVEIIVLGLAAIHIFKI